MLIYQFILQRVYVYICICLSLSSHLYLNLTFCLHICSHTCTYRQTHARDLYLARRREQDEATRRASSPGESLLLRHDCTPPPPTPPQHLPQQEAQRPPCCAGRSSGAALDLHPRRRCASGEQVGCDVMGMPVNAQEIAGEEEGGEDASHLFPRQAVTLWLLVESCRPCGRLFVFCIKKRRN